MASETIYSFSAKDIKGQEVSMDDYRGKVLLIVNTASKCGFTPQFEGLQSLHDELGERGFEVLGFPCNQFMNQDPGNDDAISQFCSLNYGVSFPMFAKIEVNGDGTHPLMLIAQGTWCSPRSSMLYCPQDAVTPWDAAMQCV